MKRIFRSIFIIISVLGVLCAAVFGIVLYRNGYTKCTHPSFSSQRIDPTCTESGYTKKLCDICSYEYVDSHLPPRGHSLSAALYPASCTERGYTLFSCDCGYSYASSFIPPSEHSLEYRDVPPSCEEQGYCEYSCSVCEYSFKGSFTAPSGHEFTSAVHRPTATRAGYTEYTCHCGYSYVGDRVYYSDILESAYVENTAVLARGLDVSRWNHGIDPSSGEYLPLDWELIRSLGFDFVILKVGSTKSGLEPTFELDYAGAREAGLGIGAYFYTYSTTVEGIVSDAELTLTYIKGKKFEYPIYLDLEDPSLSSLGKNSLSRMCEAYLGRLQEEGYYAGLYTNHNWLTTLLDTPRMVSLFDLWYARYPGTESPAWDIQKYGRQLGMWQYTQSGTVDGIEGSFDLNYAYKDYPALMKKWGLNGF